MLIIVLAMLGSSGLTFIGNYVYRIIKRRKEALLLDTSFKHRNLLGESAFQELHKCLKESDSHWLCEALIKEVIKQDHRFTSAQVILLQQIYDKKWGKGITVNKKLVAPRDYVNDLTKYWYTSQIEAEEKVTGLIDGTDKCFQITNNEIKQLAP